MQYDIEVRDAKLDAVAATIGSSPTMRIWPGSKPARCSSPDTGSPLASFELPGIWMGPASQGKVSKAGTWKDYSCEASGEPSYFRIYSQDGVCRLQGAIGIDMTLSSKALIQGQMFTVTDFSIRDGNG